MSKSPFDVREVSCKPFADQKPGTAGLRKKVAVFQQPHYLETFVHAILTTVNFSENATLVLGGDGRYYNEHGIRVIARIAAATGISRLIIGRDGILSTPAASNLIRKRRADGGIILTASHNPGGPDGDFGIKFNTSAGGQAPESLADAVYKRSLQTHSYRVADLPDFSLRRIGEQRFGDFCIEIVDPVSDYADLMSRLFDFDLIRDWLAGGGQILFDALHGVTGPYAREILLHRLGAPADSLLHAEPRPDFGGFHPDPNPVDAAHLVRRMAAPGAPELGAASDGDGDRNMILGPGQMLSPCDSIAVMLDRARSVPGYRDGVPGVARSMPTSRAVDRVAAGMDLPCFETPTGWRFFCNLLEAGRIGLCGEESFGTGSSHTREKDGLWAVLFWLNLLAASQRSMADLVLDHWRRYGRHYYQRHDYFMTDGDAAQDLVASLRGRIDRLSGQSIGNIAVGRADSFDYVDPVDHSESRDQGLRVFLEDGGRIVYRLSGTGTSGATLRVYLERYIDDPNRLGEDVSAMLQPLSDAAREIAAIERFSGLTAPTAVI